MEELIQRLMSSLGIDEGIANNFVGTALNLLKENVDPAQFEQLMSLLPGAAALLQGLQDTDSGGGLLGGLADSLGKSLGGDLGSTISGLGALSETGLDPSQFGQAAEVFGSFLQEKGAGDLASALLDALPGLK